MWNIVSIILSCTIGLVIAYHMFPNFKMFILESMVSIMKCKNPQIDGSRIFVSGSTFRRKALINAESIYVGYRGFTPAGCYFMNTNEIYITKYALDTDDGIDIYGSPETTSILVNVLSHEFMHMLLLIEHGKKATTLFDNLCSGAEGINNSGMDG